MQIALAGMDDLPDLLALHRKYHVDTIDAREKADGFVTTNFTPQQLAALVQVERGITIARHNGALVGYAMAASWQFWSAWPFFANMVELLPNYSFEGQPLRVEDSYQYGPICIDASVRGSGAFQAVFEASLKSMAGRYSVMATFINQINGRSYAAHTRKVPLQTLGTFAYNSNNYYLLACRVPAPPAGSARA